VVYLNSWFLLRAAAVNARPVRKITSTSNATAIHCSQAPCATDTIYSAQNRDQWRKRGKLLDFVFHKEQGTYLRLYGYQILKMDPSLHGAT